MSVTQITEDVVKHVQTSLGAINVHVILVTFLLMIIMGVLVCHILFY